MRGKDFNIGLRGVLFEARHYERMGSAVWLYAWLVLRQTHQSGSTGWVLGGAPVRYREIEEETGFNVRTLERWMRILRRHGYVETEPAPGGLIVRITKAKKHSQPARNPATSGTAERLRRAADGIRKLANAARNSAEGDTQNWAIIYLTNHTASAIVLAEADHEEAQDAPRGNSPLRRRTDLHRHRSQAALA